MVAKFIKKMIKILLLTVMSFFLIQSAHADTFKISNLNIEYDNIVEESTEWGDLKMYYLAEELVLSTMDSDKNGKADSWSEYENGLNISSILDSSGNNKPDYFVEFDSNGEITKEVQKKPIFDILKEKIIENKLVIGGIGFFILLLFILIFKKKRKSKK